MKLKDILFYIIIFIIGLLLSILFSCVKSNRTINNNDNIHCSINHFIDTINGHIILSTVCEKHNNVSISTLELNNNDTINVR